jgi:outer membrane protein assembly factor BamB
MNKKARMQLCLLLGFLLIVSTCFGAEFIQSFGSVWISGFFETASDLTGNDEMVYIADMNNSQIQAYKRSLEPLFHFGGYGINDGNFTSIHGIYADNTSLYTASIDSFSQKRGRIQVFSKMGLFQKTFDRPERRSDFLRVTKTRDNLIVCITENTICIYSTDGKLIKETNQALNIPFLFLQDITSLPDKTFAFIDRGRRGFFIANTAFSKVTLFADEYLSIPVAITNYMQKIFVADANGTIFCFSIDGKLIKSISTSLYINGLFLLDSNTILATSGLRRGIFKIDFNSEKVTEIKIEPNRELELHWPSSIASDGETIYLDDDFSGSIKMIASNNGQFIKQVGIIDKESIKAYQISVIDKNWIYALSKTNSNQIYQFNQENQSILLQGKENAEYIALTSDQEGSLFALDNQNKVIIKFVQNLPVATFPLPSSNEELEGIFVSDSIYISYQNGKMDVLNKKTGKLDSNVHLNPIDPLDQYKNFIVTDQYYIVSCRENHMMKLYTKSGGQLFKTYGSIGGPKTYVQKENMGVDIGFESGKFLFPEGISRWEETFFVADSGNHRIQKIPLHYLWDKDNTILLQLGSTIATLNFKSLKLEVAPMLYKNRVMVPLRFISEALGAKVDWNPNTHKITILEENVTIEIWIGNQKMKVNNKEVIIDVPPLLQNNRTLVPIRAISESLGGSVRWDSNKQTVTIRR